MNPPASNGPPNMQQNLLHNVPIAVSNKRRISAPYGPFIIAPAEGWWVGLQPNNHTVSGWLMYTSRKIPWKFHADISIRSVSERGGQEGRYLENIEGSWPETWRTGSFLKLWMMFFYLKEDTLKILCWYLNWKGVRKGGGQEGGYLEDIGGSWPETWRTIPDVMNDFFYP